MSVGAITSFFLCYHNIFATSVPFDDVDVISVLSLLSSLAMLVMTVVCTPCACRAVAVLREQGKGDRRVPVGAPP